MAWSACCRSGACPGTARRCGPGAPLQGQRFDQLADEPRQVTLGVGGVPALDDVIGDEGRVVADEDARAERDAYGEGFVVAVAEAHGVLVSGVGAAERQEPEVASAVRCHPVVLVRHLVAVHAERRFYKVNDAEVFDRDVGWRGRRGFECAEGGVVDLIGSGVKHERHGYLQITWVLCN